LSATYYLWHINSIQVILCTFPTFSFLFLFSFFLYSKIIFLYSIVLSFHFAAVCPQFSLRYTNVYYCSYGPSWSWSCGSWIYNYLCNQCFTTNVVDSTRAEMYWIHSLSVTYDKSVVFPGHTISSTNKTDRPDINEILLKVVLNTTTQPKPSW
jgi:hypothetical protein